MDINKFHCTLCNKNYASYKSLWNHNKTFHIHKASSICNPDVSNLSSKNGQINNHRNPSVINETLAYNCKFCGKIFSYRQTKWKHEQKCKLCNNKINKLEKENEDMKKELEEVKKTLLEIMNKNCKIHPKTLKKMINNGTINQATNQTINNINNIINIIPLGKEELDKFLSKEQKLSILNRKYQSLQYIIEYVHFNKKYPQFQNVMITNNRNNEAHLYDPYTKSFKIVNKDELIADLIEYRICDIEDFFGELGDNLDNKTKNIINKIIEDRGDNDNIINDVKLLLFNNRKIVLNNKLLEQ